jgi:rhamnosyltransferase
MKPYVIMRARNDMPLVEQTLAMLARQDMPHHLVVLDNASSDGTREVAVRHGAEIVEVPAGQYVPGRVLNEGMRRSQGERVVFLNSDCTPTHESWLRELLAGFDDDDVAAVFGRQVPRPDCHPLYARDTEDTYGDGELQKRWRHCFSMASSAIRRSVWERMPFDETLRYSEDIEWTWRVRQHGGRIRYVVDAVVMHSHNYTARELYRRQYGEARAEARIFEWSPWQSSFLRYAVLPYGRQVASDLRHCLKNGELVAAACAPLLRMVGMAGRWKGLQDGLREVRGVALRAPGHS